MNRAELSREINQRLAVQTEERFTGVFCLQIELSFNQGGIRDVTLSETRKERLKGG